MRSPRYAGRAFALVAAAVLLSVLVGWRVTDVLERENDFCTSCHLTPDVPLHRDIRGDFDAHPARSLAAAHGAAQVEGREDAAFRCIDCHGGASLLGRARVKLLAGKDAFWYVAGRFDEPDSMRWPLWDEDCRQCHARFDERASAEWESPRFHELSVHNVDLGVDCVECHLSHEPGGNADAYFVHAAHVRSQCARCHSEFEEGSP